MENPSENGALIAKAVAMCVLFVASMTLGSLPIKLSHWFKWSSSTSSPEDNIYVQVLLCAGGGVLLCTTFLHLLPEVAENLENTNLPDIGLPIADLLMCAGFFTIYLVEEVLHLYLHKRTKRSEKSKLVLDLELNIESPKEGHEDHSHLLLEDTTIVTIRGLLVVLALSVHELFEGLSVGLEAHTESVWYMFGAVSAHKLVIAFCVGIELVTSGMRTLFVVIYVFTFAIVSPLGIGIGMIVSELEGIESSAALPSVILQGLASGTLLYVVFFEILREKRKSGLRQYLSVLAGFSIMTLITMAIGDHHEHGD